MEKLTKEHIYHQNAFSLLLLKAIGIYKKPINRMRVVGTLAAAGIKASFKIGWPHDYEREERNECYTAFCDYLFKSLNKGIK